MLNKYLKQYAEKSNQFILTNEEGKILESDEVIWPTVVGQSILELHPFFQSIPLTVSDKKTENRVFCVHLEINETAYIVDIRQLFVAEGVLFIIQNLTDHYTEYQLVAQSRNESVIEKELTVLKNIELQQREQFKNKFIQNFSHELRNPLTSIMAIVDLLRETELTNEQQSLLAFLQESNSNLRLMLEDTLSIGMIDAGKLKISQKVFDLSRFFDLIEFTYTSKAKKKGLNFSSYYDKNIPKMVEGDRLRLFQVVTNLLDNALKYTKEGEITFKISLNQKRANTLNLRFEVSDTGVGIANEDQKTVFESFQQVSNENTKRGVGLGLTIVKKLLELMESKIMLRSIVDEGTILHFDITLKYPLFPGVDKTKKVDNQVPKPLKSSTSKFNLLLVEDDELVQAALFKILLKTQNYNINLAYDGALVLQEVVNNNYDIILMDVNLPNINGLQLTKLIRDFPFKNIKNIPIVGITANAYQTDLDQYLKAGMNDVLTKPFDKEDLVNSLSRFLKT